MLRPLTPYTAAVSWVTGSGANFSFRTASFDRYSSIPIYAPHMRRFPSKAERPWSTRWLSTTTSHQHTNMRDKDAGRTDGSAGRQLHPVLRVGTSE